MSNSLNFRLLLDPGMWNEHHVKHWIQWAVKEFSLTGVDVNQFNLTGKELCDLQHEVSKRNLSFLMPVGERHESANKISNMHEDP